MSRKILHSRPEVGKISLTSPYIEQRLHLRPSRSQDLPEVSPWLSSAGIRQRNRRTPARRVGGRCFGSSFLWHPLQDDDPRRVNQVRRGGGSQSVRRWKIISLPKEGNIFHCRIPNLVPWVIPCFCHNIEGAPAGVRWTRKCKTLLYTNE